jgi:hypothetical protein
MAAKQNRRQAKTRKELEQLQQDAFTDRMRIKEKAGLLDSERGRQHELRESQLEHQQNLQKMAYKRSLEPSFEQELQQELQKKDALYSLKQQQERSRIKEAVDYVRRNPDGIYMPDEQQQALRQLLPQLQGMEPLNRQPTPQEIVSESMWVDPSTGHRMLVDPESGKVEDLDSGIDERIAEKKIDIFNSLVGANEIGISEGNVNTDTLMEKADRMVKHFFPQRFFSDDMPLIQENTLAAIKANPDTLAIKYFEDLEQAGHRLSNEDKQAIVSTFRNGDRDAISEMVHILEAKIGG